MTTQDAANFRDRLSATAAACFHPSTAIDGVTRPDPTGCARTDADACNFDLANGDMRLSGVLAYLAANGYPTEEWYAKAFRSRLIGNAMRAHAAPASDPC